MLSSNRILVILAFVVTSSGALAQDTLTSPAMGTPERKAILDGLRPTVERRLKSELRFSVSDIRAYKGWAMVTALPQRKDGGTLDIGQLFGEQSEYMDGLTVTAVLQRKGAEWVLVEHMIGATDVWWQKFCDERPRRVPSEVLGVCLD